MSRPLIYQPFQGRQPITTNPEALKPTYFPTLGPVLLTVYIQAGA